MKLFVQGQCGHKMQLQLAIKSRTELPAVLPVQCSKDGVVTYCQSRSITAEAETAASSPVTIAVGAALGIVFAGPLGALLGGGAGLALAAKQENDLVDAFNKS